MSRRASAWILGIALLLVLASLAWWWQGGRAGGRRGRRGDAARTGGAAATERRAFDLYFPSSGGGLRAERRDLQVTEEPKDRIRKVVEALLAGPAAITVAAAPAAAGSPPATTATQERPPLVRPFPPAVKVGGVQLAVDGTAFVELEWPDHDDPPESGSTEEIQRVYSLVDSITLNIPQVNRVALLWNGTQRLTFSGHLDTSRPLVPDRTLLAAP